MKKLSTIFLTGAILFTIPSCSFYRHTTIAGCFPEDKDDKITLKQRAANHISGVDSLYNIKTYENSIIKDSGIKLERKF